MFSNFNTGLKSKQNPSLKIFEKGVIPGIHNLDKVMVNNGVSQSPYFRYNLKDATASVLPGWEYGSTLSITGSGADITLNNGSPLLGSYDDSAKFNAGKVYGSASFGDITTEDFLIEIIFKADKTQSSPCFASKMKDGTGWSLGMVGSGDSRLALTIAINNSTAICYTDPTNIVIETDAWHHALVFVNRNISGLNGCVFFVNGVFAGATTEDFSALPGSLSNDGIFTIGGQDVVDNLLFNSNIAYCTMWKKDNWFADGNAGEDAYDQFFLESKRRFGNMTGAGLRYPSNNFAPFNPRLTIANVVKTEGSAKKMYPVGRWWTRAEKRTDSNSTAMHGLLIENAATNQWAYSSTTANWGIVNCTMGAAITTPDGKSSICSLVANNTNGYHYVWQGCTFGVVDRYTISIFAQKGDRRYIAINAGWITNATAWFDLQDGVVGTVLAGVKDTLIENYGNNWYRCSMMIDNPSNAYRTPEIFPTNVNAAPVYAFFAGDGSTISQYMWGLQVEQNYYPTSYFPTGASAAARGYDLPLFFNSENLLSSSLGTATADVLIPNHDSGNLNIFNMDNNSITGTSTIALAISSSDKAEIVATTVPDGTQVITGSADITNNVIHTIKETWKTNDVRLYVDGTQVTTTISTITAPPTFDYIRLGASHLNTNQLNAIMSNIKVYKRPISK